MKWDNFKDQFHESWHEKIRPFIESEQCDTIYKYLKKKSKEGKQIAPLSTLTFRAFKETRLDKLKVVLLGYCPYHTFYGNYPVADGLAFSCSITGKQQPSLEKFIDGIEKDAYSGLKLDYNKKMSDLTYLANQGVLLLNSSLTVEKDKAGSHQELWKPFTKYVLEECLAYTGAPIVFIGKDAQKFKKSISPLTHGYSFEIEHPASAARIQDTWDTQGVFSKINELLKMNDKFNVIYWLDELPF